MKPHPHPSSIRRAINESYCIKTQILNLILLIYAGSGSKAKKMCSEVHRSKGFAGIMRLGA